MLSKIRSALLSVLLAGSAWACRAAGPAQSPTARPAESRPSTTPTPGLSTASFSEGLLLAVVKDQASEAEIYPVDPRTGGRLAGYAPIRARNYFFAYSPDMQALALITLPDGEGKSNGQLHLLRLETWQDRVFDLKVDGWVNSLRFSPDGKMLAVAHGDSASRLMIVDTFSGTIVARAETDIIVRLMSFTSGNKGLMLYGPAQQSYTAAGPGAPKAVLLAVADLSLEWTAALTDLRDGLYPKTENADSLPSPVRAWNFTPGVAFAPDRDALYIVHADEDKLTSVDFGLRSVQSMDIRPKLGWFEQLLAIGARTARAKIMDGTEKQLVSSPDGRRLYVVGINSSFSQLQNEEWEQTRTPLGLQVIDPQDGGQIAHFETPASDLAISPDGRALYLRGWDEGPADFTAWTEVVDASSGAQLAEKRGLFLIPTRDLGGRPILVAQRCDSQDHCDLAVVLPDSLAILNQFSVSQYGGWVTP